MTIPLTKDEFENLFSLITEKIMIVEKEKYEKYLKEAEKIIGSVDKNDIPFIALALSVSNDGIWTDDSDFYKQNRIKVWRTVDITKKLNTS